jgi:hypothetical protein
VGKSEAGNKLEGRVREGKWLGIDEESKGVRVYWPDTKTITVEWNTYYDNLSASHLEGEQTIKLTTNEMSTDSSTPNSTHFPVDEPSNGLAVYFSVLEYYSTLLSY